MCTGPGPSMSFLYTGAGAKKAGQQGLHNAR